MGQLAGIVPAQERKPLFLEWSRKTREYCEELAEATTQALPVSWLAGIPIERVSILLGHQSTRVTEKHYNPWVRSRQEQLEEDLERAWSRDPLVPVEAKVTRRLRGERERVN